MRRLAVAILLAGMMVVPAAAAQEARPSPSPVRVLCVFISGTDAPMTSAPLVRGILDRTVRVLLVVDACTRSDLAPEPTPSAMPTASPVWERENANLSWRWLSDGEYECSASATRCWGLAVRADKGCPNGLEVEVDIEDGEEDFVDHVTLRRTKALGAGKVARFVIETDEEGAEWADIDDIGCVLPPWTRTYRGSGADDRFIRLPAADDVRARFTVRATHSIGCVTGVYFGSGSSRESIDEFDLFFSGRRTLTRNADVTYDVGAGRNHLKVISSCPWTLKLTGRR
ncbi:MAG: hypothetical protein KF809_13015 [Chloroflexi bacterium]|nr:hypothetical protein [Chloroflexota bacterium]